MPTRLGSRPTLSCSHPKPVAERLVMTTGNGHPATRHQVGRSASKYACDFALHHPSLSSHPRKMSSGAEAADERQLTAFFTSAPILASSAAVNSFSAKATGHRAPSSRFAASLKPNVAYLVLNFCALWKKQTTLPSLA